MARIPQLGAHGRIPWLYQVFKRRRIFVGHSQSCRAVVWQEKIGRTFASPFLCVQVNTTLTSGFHLLGGKGFRSEAVSSSLGVLESKSRALIACWPGKVCTPSSM